MFDVGRDFCGSSSPTPLPKQGHLEQVGTFQVETAGIERVGQDRRKVWRYSRPAWTRSCAAYCR